MLQYFNLTLVVLLYYFSHTMKQISVKIPDKLEAAFDRLVRVEFGGNVNQAVVSVLAEKIGVVENSLVDRVGNLEDSMEKIRKWLKEQRIEL